MRAYKFLIIICLTYCEQRLNAQETTTTSEAKPRMNVLKTNLLSPLSIGFERGFGAHFSLVLNGLYFPSISFGEPTKSFGYVSLADPSSGFSVELRLYTSKTKAPLNGFYVGGYYLFRIADIYSHRVSVTATSTTTTKIYIPSDVTSYGIMIGKQKIRAKGFTTDFNFGVGYYKVSNVPNVIDDGDESSKLLRQLSNMKTGIFPRICFSLGYAF
jgi:Protein of unknown function (DUF3575)